MDSPGQAVGTFEFGTVVGLLDAHGARGHGRGNRNFYDESTRWLAARFMLVCLPETIFGLHPNRDKFVPVISMHLEQLGLPWDKRSCLVLKGIAEQMIFSNPNFAGPLDLKVKRKYGVSDLRALGHYNALAAGQEGRCATCGVRLEQAESVELDHIIPFSFIGDISDGSNWQLLCGECNLGKHGFLSSWLSPDAWNWPTSTSIVGAVVKPTPRARYSVLATRGACEAANCGKGAQETELVLNRRHSTGLYIPSNLTVRCAFHADL